MPRQSHRENTGAPLWSEEAEQAVLGAILLDGQALSIASEMLQPADFYRDGHRLIYEAALRLADAGTPVDLVTVAEALAGDLQRAGGSAYLAGLANILPTVANVEYYAQQVRELSRRRALVRAARLIAELAGDREQELEAVLDQAQQAVFELAAAGMTREAEHIAHVFADRWEYLYETRDDPGAGGIMTGFADLDKVLGGLQPGLVVLAARPSMGKTALALQIGLNVAQSGKPVGFFSLEMSKAELADRLAGIRLGYESLRLRRRLLQESDWEAGSALAPQLGSWPLYVDDTSTLTTMDIRSRARALARKRGLGLVIVDHLQFLGDQQRAGQSRNDLIGEETRRLKALAKEMGVPVLVLSQLSRASEHRSDKRPQLSDLRDSGNIEQDADVVLLLHRPSYYKADDKPGVAEVNVAKQRNGPVGTVELSFDARLTRFGNLYRGVAG